MSDELTRDWLKKELKEIWNELQAIEETLTKHGIIVEAGEEKK